MGFQRLALLTASPGKICLDLTTSPSSLRLRREPPLLTKHPQAVIPIWYMNDMLAQVSFLRLVECCNGSSDS